MKKTALYALALLMMSTVSCSKEDDFLTNEDLLGVWYEVTDYSELDQARTTEWSFRDNGTIEIVSIESEKSTKEFLGFSYMSIGNYIIKDNMLFMQNMRSASYNFDGDSMDDAVYLMDKESFLFGGEETVWSNRASVSSPKRNRELVLTLLECVDVFDCGSPRAQTFTRKE